jgi:ketosteroid isomerase-like protein
MDASNLDHVIEQYHHALEEFIKGNPGPQFKRFSHRDDVSLANPFGPTVIGWPQVKATMEHASSLLHDAEPVVFERITSCVTPELAFIVETERARVRLGELPESVPISLRVTTIFRPEDGTWKVVHRHADTITSPRPPESIIQQ